MCGVRTCITVRSNLCHIILVGLVLTPRPLHLRPGSEALYTTDPNALNTKAPVEEDNAEDAELKITISE